MIDLVNRIYLHQCSAYCYKETHRRGEAHTHTDGSGMATSNRARHCTTTRFVAPRAECRVGFSQGLHVSFSSDEAGTSAGIRYVAHTRR